jgi:hypothetical protein
MEKLDSVEMIIQKKFLEQVNLYNEVVVSNKIIFGVNLKNKYMKQKNTRIEMTPSTSKKYPWDQELFYSYICKKAADMQQGIVEYKDELSFYYSYYRRNYNSCSVVVIVLSSCIPLVEGISLCFDPIIYTNIVILVLGTLVSIITSLLKFLNYKNKMEEIIRIREKINNCEAKIFYFDKKLKSKLFLMYGDNK